MFCRLASLLLAGLLCATPAFAILKYVDDQGRTIFVDREEKIPARYRPHTQAVGSADNVRVSRPQPAAEMATNRPQETPIQIVNNLVLLPVEMEQGGRRQSFNFLVDTGASHSVLYEGHMLLMSFPHEGLTSARVVGGGVVSGRRVTVDRLRIGPYEVRDLPAALMEDSSSRAPFAGILGNDVLRQIRYEVDFETQVIRWLP